MTVLARPATRRLVSAAAALALGAGVVAATATTADATTRSSRTVRVLDAGGVSSKVTAGDTLAVTSTLGASTAQTYVESVVKGRLTLACFADGAVVPGSGQDDGTVTTGYLEGTPWNNSGYYVDAVAAPSTTTSTVTAPVVLKNILRDQAGDLAGVTCAAGTTPGFYRYRITSVASERHLFSGAVVGSYSAATNVSYWFDAPQS